MSGIIYIPGFFLFTNTFIITIIITWWDGRAWLNARLSKSRIPAKVSGVRIPLPPPGQLSIGANPSA